MSFEICSASLSAKSILLCDCVSQEPIEILKKPHALLAYCLLSDNVQFLSRSAVRQRLVMQLSKHGQCLFKVLHTSVKNKNCEKFCSFHNPWFISCDISVSLVSSEVARVGRFFWKAPYFVDSNLGWKGMTFKAIS